MSPENCKTTLKVPCEVPGNTTPPLLVADGIHVLNPQVHRAITTQDTKKLELQVCKQLASGAQALAVNLGPGKKMGEMTSWVMETIREVTDTQLFFSENIVRNVQVMQDYGSKITINAVTAGHGELVEAFEAAGEYGSSVVVLLIRPGRMTSGIDARIRLASEIIEQAIAIGLPLSRLYLDPVLSCHPDPAAWTVSRGLPDVASAAETISLIKQLDCQVKTIVALGNSSAGVTRENRSSVHSSILSVLAEAGVDAVLLNCLDKEVMRTADAIQKRSAFLPAQEAGRFRLSTAV